MGSPGVNEEVDDGCVVEGEGDGEGDEEEDEIEEEEEGGSGGLPHGDEDLVTAMASQSGKAGSVGRQSKAAGPAKGGRRGTGSLSVEAPGWLLKPHGGQAGGKQGAREGGARGPGGLGVLGLGSQSSGVRGTLQPPSTPLAGREATGATDGSDGGISCSGDAGGISSFKGSVMVTAVTGARHPHAPAAATTAAPPPPHSSSNTSLSSSSPLTLMWAPHVSQSQARVPASPSSSSLSLSLKPPGGQLGVASAGGAMAATASHHFSLGLGAAAAAGAGVGMVVGDGSEKNGRKSGLVPSAAGEYEGDARGTGRGAVSSQDLRAEESMSLGDSQPTGVPAVEVRECGDDSPVLAWQCFVAYHGLVAPSAGSRA